MIVSLEFREQTFPYPLGKRLVASHPTDTNVLVFEAELAGRPRQIRVPGAYRVEVTDRQVSKRGHPYYNGWPVRPKVQKAEIEVPHPTTTEVVLASSNMRT